MIGRHFSQKQLEMIEIGVIRPTTLEPVKLGILENLKSKYASKGYRVPRGNFDCSGFVFESERLLNGGRYKEVVLTKVKGKKTVTMLVITELAKGKSVILVK